jgi:HK97 family phage major capsid protein
MATPNLQKQRTANVAQMRAILATADAESRSLTSKEGTQFDKLESEIQSIDQKLGASDPDADRFLAAVRRSERPPMMDIGGFSAGPSETWVDKEGRRISVLGKGQSLAAVARERGEEAPPYDLGDVVKYMAGVRVPSEIKAALGESGGSSGQYLVNPVLSAQIIDRVRAKSQCFNAGMKTVEMPEAILYAARLTTDPGTVWHAENTADLMASTPVFDRVTFTARTLGSVILLSKELIQDAPNVSDEITYALVKSMALEIDRAALLGDGSNNSPYGLANITGGGVSTTAGTAITDYSQFVSSIGRITQNSMFPTAVITSPQIATKVNGLQNTLHDSLRAPAVMDRVPILETAKVPYGASPLTGSAFYTGDFTNLMLGVRMELELNLLRERFVEYGQVGIAAWYRCDVQVAHPGAFDIVTGVS